MDQQFFYKPFAVNGNKTDVPVDLQPDGSVSYDQGYGFDYERDPAMWKVTHFEKTAARDLFKATGPWGTFNVTYYGRWGTLKLGWKAWNYFDPATGDWKPNYQWGPEQRAPFVFSYSPFRRK